MGRCLLLTGAGGYLGSAVRRLAGGPAPLAVVPLSRAGARTEIEAAAAAATGPVALLHLAWPALGAAGSRAGGAGSDDQAWDGFVSWTEGVCRAAAGAGVPVFCVGSGIERYAVEGGTLGEPYAGYARRKAALWARVGAIAGGRAWRLRVHFLFGPGEAPHRFVPAAFRAAETASPFALGRPERRRHWLHVDDAARGLLEAAFHEDPQDWDIVGPSAVSFGELAALIEGVAGRRLQRVEPDPPPADNACALVEPENPARFLPSDWGSGPHLEARLADYHRSLHAA